MKRLLLILFACMIFMSGCNSNEKTENNNKDNKGNATVTDITGVAETDVDKDSEKIRDFEVSDLANALKEGIAFEDELIEGRDIVFEKRYGFEEGDYVSQSSFFSTMATTEEIVVVKCNSNADAIKIEETFKTKLEEQKEVFADYAPDEVKRLENAVVTVLDCYAVLCVSSEPEKAEEIIAGF
ncbi:MAG: DUF4358 domain-containing protein [Lachnospiraceae bacterium]